MSRRPASESLPQYGLKQSDYPSKKAWQSARARKAGYSSYSDWLKERRSEGVKRTNLGRSSETYKTKIAGKPKPIKNEAVKLRSGQKIGTRYFFNIKKDGWGPFNAFLLSLPRTAQIQIQVKTSRGRYLEYTSRRAAGMIQDESGMTPSYLDQMVKKQSPDKKKKGKAPKKEEEITEAYIMVFGQ